MAAQLTTTQQVNDLVSLDTDMRLTPRHVAQYVSDEKSSIAAEAEELTDDYLTDRGLTHVDQSMPDRYSRRETGMGYQQMKQRQLERGRGKRSHHIQAREQYR